MPDAYEQPTVFYQPGASVSGAQAASISSLIASRSDDESHIVSMGFAVQTLLASRMVDEANIQTLTDISTNHLTTINSLIASRTADEALIATLRVSVAALQATAPQDTTINSFWCNAFGDGSMSMNYDGSINPTAGSLTASIRICKTNSQVTLMMSACLGQPALPTHTAIFAQCLPSWARPSAMTYFPLNVYSDGVVSGELSIASNGAMVLRPLNNVWGNSSGLQRNIYISYIV